MADVPAHTQVVSHRYTMHYPEHAPRADDPHKADFEEYKRRRKADGTYYCDFAHEHRAGDTSECDNEHPLECHHNKIELALANGVSFDLLDKDYPGISKETIGAWIDSDPNLCLMCQFHHRGHGGVHIASFSDFTAEEYVRGVIS